MKDKDKKPMEETKENKLEDSTGIPVSYIRKWMEENATNSDIRVMFETLLQDYERSMSNHL